MSVRLKNPWVGGGGGFGTFVGLLDLTSNVCLGIKSYLCLIVTYIRM